jgi:hypothetical protein
MFGFDWTDAADSAPQDSRLADEMQAAVFRKSLRVIPEPMWEFMLGSLSLCVLTDDPIVTSREVFSREVRCFQLPKVARKTKPRNGIPQDSRVGVE